MSANATLPTDLPAGAVEMAEKLMSEGLIGMAEAARHMGTRREGRDCHPSTISRWANNGVKLADGTVVKLEFVRLGERLLTSRPALARFIARQQNPNNIPLSQLNLRSPANRRKALDAADKQLSEMGV
jgi:hypothetical protein